MEALGGARGNMERDRRRRRRAHLASLLLLALAPGGCAGSGHGRPRIAASIFPLYDITRRVAGDRLPVQLVLPAGQSEHTFDPKPPAVKNLPEAQLLFPVGLGLHHSPPT